MTTISLYIDQARTGFSGPGIVGFKATGHTGYAQAGEDIVCAAVSALTQVVVLGLQDVVGVDLEIELTDEYLSCRVREVSDSTQWMYCQVLLETLRKGSRAIVQEYREYVQVKEVEL